MPHLIDWQHRNKYQMRLTAEASVNLAEDTDLLEQMREAYFTDVFLGIETPDAQTLRSISKRQNVRRPLLDSIDTLNRHGIEVVTGIIFGFDNETADHAERAIQFVEASNIPMAVLNVLYALPRTPLHRRLQVAGRLLEREVGGSNIAFELGNEAIAGQLRRAVDRLYDPPALYRRYHHQVRNTYPNRKKLDLRRFKLDSPAVRFGAAALGRVLWRIGARADYRAEFWKVAADLVRTGAPDGLLYIGAMGHHLTKYREDVLAGRIAESTFSHREGAMS